jgi:hypothetical protein
MATNWATVIPAVVTGAVGIAGIGGTILSAKLTAKTQTANLGLSIGAENHRARLAEKRRIYATFMASHERALEGVVKHRASFRLSESTNDIKAMETIQRDARSALGNARAEMGLIEPVNFGSLPDQLVEMLRSYAEATAIGARELDKPTPAVDLEVQDQLYTAMRTDLTEPFS